MGKNKRIYSKNSLKWIRGIMMLLLPILIGCAILCTYSIKTTENIIITTNGNLTASIQNNLDIRFREFNHYMDALELSNTNKELKRLTHYPQKITEKYYQFSNQIREFALANELVAGIYIYYPQSGLVVGNLGCYKASSYYGLMNFPENTGYKAWLQALQDASSNCLVSLSFEKEDHLAHVRKTYTYGECTAIMAIEIDQDELERVMDSSYYMGEAVSCILVAGIPAVVIGESSYGPMIVSLYEAWKNLDKAVISNNGIYAFFSNSVLKNVDYVCVFSAKSLLHTMYSLLYLCTCVLIVCVILSIVLSILLVRRNTKPVRQLVESIGVSGDINTIDEYRLISNRIRQLVEEKYRDERKMLDLQSKLNGLFFNTLLYGKFQNERDVFALAEHYGVTFEHPFYQVAVLRNRDGICFDATESCLSPQYRNIDTTDCFITICDDSFVVLMNTEERLPYNEAEQYIRRLLESVFPNQPAHAGIGTCCDNTLQISDSYHAAKRLLQKTDPETNYPIIHSGKEGFGTPGNEMLSAVPQELQIRDRIARKAAEIVDREFTNSMIGLYYIADKLEVSNSYLSSAFKSVYGIGIIQFINTKRIELAKELLMNTEKSVKEIALLVGFSSDINFIRVFKKYESCTPTAMRKQE